MIVVEVLSLSTQSIDVADKLADYFRVASRRREVIHHRRGGKDILTHVINTGAIAFDPPGIAIDIADLSDDLA